jgi:hypothetical protein
MKNYNNSTLAIFSSKSKTSFSKKASKIFLRILVSRITNRSLTSLSFTLLGYFTSSMSLQSSTLLTRTFLRISQRFTPKIILLRFPRPKGPCSRSATPALQSRIRPQDSPKETKTSFLSNSCKSLLTVKTRSLSQLLLVKTSSRKLRTGLLLRSS